MGRRELWLGGDAFRPPGLIPLYDPRLLWTWLPDVSQEVRSALRRLVELGLKAKK
jgi:hypothetical protein